jgi:hypothetical protein
MEQQTATETKVATIETKVATIEPKVAAIKRTIPNKQKSAIKLVMWTLSQVMEKEAMLAKIVEMFKVTETIETIIEMVDAVEKSPEYTMMDTELTAIRSPKTKKRAKVTGDPDAIIKQLVDMATTETASGKKKAKAPKVEGEEAPKKAPRGKKATDAPAATEGTATEPKKKAPRAKKVAKVDDSKVDDSKAVTTEAEAEAKSTTDAPTVAVETEPKKKAPRAKKATTTEAPKAPTTEEAPKAPTDEPKAPKAPKKAPAKKTKTTVESNGTAPNGTESTETKAPKAPKTKAPVQKQMKSSEIAPPNELVEVAEDLSEDEYMLLNEVVVDGKIYMVDSSQNVYNDFNDVIGKYENGVVTMNA